MIKDIFVNLSVAKSRNATAEYAVSLAGHMDAHLSAVAFAYEPVMPGSVFDGVAPSIIDACRTENQKAAQKAKHQFDETARRAGASFESSIVSAGTASAANLFGKMARRYDLAVVAQSQPNDDFPENDIIQSALFNTGRPLLIVPYIQKDAFKVDRVMVCWDGSHTAARAIGDAIPLIQRAGKVELVTIEPRERQDTLSGADIALHLARHDLKVELKPIVASGADVASTLLSYAADSAIDLIVMGGYGHSRLREFVLGGATRGILQSMTVPTLMSH